MTPEALCSALLVAPVDRMAPSCELSEKDALEALHRELDAARALCDEQVVRAATEGRLVIDGEKASACVVEVERAGRSWLGPHAASLNLAAFPACRGVLVGRQASGDVCATELECKDGLRCVGAKDGSLGRCSEPSSDTACRPGSAAFAIDRRSACPPSKQCVPVPEYKAPMRIGSGRRDPPTLRPGEATVSEGLPRVVVYRIVRQNLGRFRLCYEAALKSAPELAGKVDLAFTIDASGTVRAASAKASTIEEPTFRACLEKSLTSLSFPQPEGSASVRVSYPMAFGPPAKGDPVRPVAVETGSWLDGRPGTCEAPPSGDAPCVFHTDCPLDSYCSTAPVHGDPNRCEKRKTAGAKCFEAVECLGTCTVQGTCASVCASG